MKMPFVLDSPQVAIEVLQEVNPTGQSTPLDRDAMLSQYRKGERNSVTFKATTYVHGANRNHTRLDDAELEKFAASFKGQPFLSDHAREQGKRGGTILESRLVERDGKKAIEQTVKAVKGWAVEGLLDGTVDRFSIGWNAEKYDCTACEKPFFSCGHSIVDLGKKDKDGKTVEVLMKGLEGMEVSAVTHPAVTGTGVLDALRQLQQSTETASREALTVREDEMKDKIFGLLSLSAETTEADALLALEKRLKAPTEKVPAAMLTALELKPEASTDEAIAKLIQLTYPGAFVAKAEHEKIVQELKDLRAHNRVREATAAGKLEPHNVPWALKLAQDNPEAFDAFIAHAPVGSKVPLVGSITPPNMSNNAGDSVENLSEREREVIQKMGVTPEQYLEAKRADRARAN